jgi:hypothetical protein
VVQITLKKFNCKTDHEIGEDDDEEKKNNQKPSISSSGVVASTVSSTGEAFAASHRRSFAVVRIVAADPALWIPARLRMPLLCL